MVIEGDMEMREPLDLLKWFLLGSLCGFPLGAEIAAGGNLWGVDLLALFGTAARLTLLMGGLCLLAIVLMRKAKLI